MAVRDIDVTKFTAKFATTKDTAVWLLKEITTKELATATNHFLKLYEKNKNVLLIDSLKTIDGFEEMEDVCSDCTSLSTTPFVQIKETCGNFNKKTWLSKAKSTPFSIVKTLKTPNATLNERLVLQFWNQMHNSFRLMV
jgi:hypothetical protein